jgi:hypothetical protein
MLVDWSNTWVFDDFDYSVLDNLLAYAPASQFPRPKQYGCGCC